MGDHTCVIGTKRTPVATSVLFKSRAQKVDGHVVTGLQRVVCSCCVRVCVCVCVHVRVRLQVMFADVHLMTVQPLVTPPTPTHTYIHTHTYTRARTLCPIMFAKIMCRAVLATAVVHADRPRQQERVYAG